MQKHLFIIDPLENLNLTLDTSLRIAYELDRRGVSVYVATCSDLLWNSVEGLPKVMARKASFQEDFTSTRFDPAVRKELVEFTGIHMRKEPPVDILYQSATWMLDRVADRVSIFNRPSSLWWLNEKVGTLMFPSDGKQSLVACSLSELMSFLVASCDGDGIIKPLDMYGGRGIRRVGVRHGESRAQAEALLKEATAGFSRPVIMQGFDATVHDGEVRAFALGGKALAWCLKKPRKGTFLANTASGATLHPYEPSAAIVDRVNSVAGELFQRDFLLLVLISLVD